MNVVGIYYEMYVIFVGNYELVYVNMFLFGLVKVFGFEIIMKYI